MDGRPDVYRDLSRRSRARTSSRNFSVARVRKLGRRTIERPFWNFKSLNHRTYIQRKYPTEMFPERKEFLSDACPPDIYIYIYIYISNGSIFETETSKSELYTGPPLRRLRSRASPQSARFYFFWETSEWHFKKE